MQTQHSLASAALALLTFTLLFAAHSLPAQSPLPVEDYEMPEELAALHSQYRSIPDCMYEYEVHFHPPIDKVVHQFHCRFITARGMWRYDRVDDNGLTFYKVCFDGKVFHQFFKECDIGRIRPPRPDPKFHHQFFTGKNLITITPNPLPEEYPMLACTEFSWNPLFAPIEMPFLARPREFKTPDLHSEVLWKDVLRRSTIRHRMDKGTPANQVHFFMDDDALNGILKLEKLDTPGLPPWRVLEHDYMTRAGSRHVVTKYEGWRQFPVGEKAGEGPVLHMPTLTTVTAKGVPQTTVLTIKLLPDTVAPATRGLTIEDFRIPDSISNPPAQVMDFTNPPAEGAVAKKTKATKPTGSAAKPEQKPKLGGSELKPPPKLKPAPKL